MNGENPIPEIDRDHLASLLTTSAKIRYLYPILGTCSAVAEHLGIRYQHVWNVVKGPSAIPENVRSLTTQLENVRSLTTQLYEEVFRK